MKGLRFCLAMVLAVVLLISASYRFAAADLLATSDQLVNVQGSTTNGIILSFLQVLPDATTSVFTIPAGKVFVVTRVQGGASATGNFPGLRIVLETKSNPPKAYLKHGMDSIWYDSGTNTTGGGIRGENYYPGFPISKPFRARLLGPGPADILVPGTLNMRIFGYLADIPAP